MTCPLGFDSTLCEGERCENQEACYFWTSPRPLKNFIHGYWIKANKLGPKVLQMVQQGHSYRKNAEKLNLSKTTVNEIVKRHRQSAKQAELEK